jgi:hypothetical protein
MEFVTNKRPLFGRGSNILGNPEDLVALYAAPENDRISRWLSKNMGFLFKVSDSSGCRHGFA